MGTMLETRNLIIYGAKALLKERRVMINLENSLNNSKWGEAFFNISYRVFEVPFVCELLLASELLEMASFG